MFQKPEIDSFDVYKKNYHESISEPSLFWEKIAKSFIWDKPFTKVFQGGFEKADFKWFIEGKTNITLNCLDRHLEKDAQKTAFIFEPNDPDENSIALTYQELFEKVCQFANLLKSNGVKKGDRVCLYMPMTLEAGIALLACARIGAVHSVVFAGFSAQSLSERIEDSQCKLLITSNTAFRGTKEIPLKEIVDQALETSPSIKKVIVLKRTPTDVPMKSGRDLWWHEEIILQPKHCLAEMMDAEDPLFILYTSGSTGKPKGLLHTVGGYMVFVGYSFRNVFQIKEKDIFWCSADIGWITGHSYVVYGPLLNGLTTLFFEGVPTHPTPSRFWDVIDKHQVNIFYTAPTAIRALEQFGVDPVRKNSLSSLRILGSVGEPINEEAWQWYSKEVGHEKCPIVDTWWQTETGGILISPLAGLWETPPSYATFPLPGIEPVLVDEQGKEIPWKLGESISGNLCIKNPWPSSARTTYGDHSRFIQTYFTTYKGYYFTGDGCLKNEKGMYRITGRVDDVINVSGHRISTAEVENAINEHPEVIESAVVGFPHAIKGQGIYAFVILNIQSQKNSQNLENLVKEIQHKVTESIGSFSRPDSIQVVEGLPKTRSGKIMRRILRKIAEGATLSELGDTSTLLDPSVVEKIKKGFLIKT